MKFYNIFRSYHRLLACLFLSGLVGNGLHAEEDKIADADLPPVMQLYREYLEHNGGRANLQALTTLIVSGRIEHVSGKVNTFKIFQKRPDKMRIKVDADGYSLDTVSNGDTGWREYVSDQGERSLTELDPETIRSMNLESSIEGPFYRAGQRSEQVKPVAFEAVRGHPAIKVAVEAGSDSPYDTLWLSEEHFQEVKAARRIPANEATRATATTLLEEVYFSDFETVDGVYIAKRIEYYVDGSLNRTVVVDGARANVGIFDSYFQRPVR